jgi:hypothetical protein
LFSSLSGCFSLSNVFRKNGYIFDFFMFPTCMHNSNCREGVEVKTLAFCIHFLTKEFTFVGEKFPFLFSGKCANSAGCALMFRVLRKACITKRNRTGDMLCPWFMPVV